MSERIEVGDLVVVVRWPHPCLTQNLGRIFRVHGFNVMGARCPKCQENLGMHGISAVLEGVAGAPVSWLKRIPPLSELESTEHKEEMPA